MAKPPEGQSCETCAYFINGTCRRKLPEIIAPTVYGWLACDPSAWCFNWKADPEVPSP